MTGFAFCGSFCNMSRAIDVLCDFKARGVDILPICSEKVYSTDTRFGKAEDFVEKIEDICGRKIVHSIVDAEPIGPRIVLDALVVCPCTGNTCAKMAHGICDGAVTMATKAHLRNGRPLVLALATNDALSLCAPNIGTLLSRKNVYFTPMGQDDPMAKPRSVVCDFSRVYDTYLASLEGRQIQPILK